MAINYTGGSKVDGQSTTTPIINKVVAADMGLIMEQLNLLRNEGEPNNTIFTKGRDGTIGSTRFRDLGEFATTTDRDAYATPSNNDICTVANQLGKLYMYNGSTWTTLEPFDAQTAILAIDDELGGAFWRNGGSEYLGEYADVNALTTAHPTGTSEQYALVGAPGSRTFYNWNGSAWVDTNNVPSSIYLLAADYVGNGTLAVNKAKELDNLPISVSESVKFHFDSGNEEYSVDVDMAYEEIDNTNAWVFNSPASAKSNSVVKIDSSSGDASYYLPEASAVVNGTHLIGGYPATAGKVAIYGTGANSIKFFVNATTTFRGVPTSRESINGSYREVTINAGEVWILVPILEGATSIWQVVTYYVADESTILDNIRGFNVDLTSIAEGDILVYQASNSTFVKKTPDAFIIKAPVLINTIVGLSYTANEATLDTTTIAPSVVVEGQTFLSAGNRYQIMEINGNDATILRTPTQTTAITHVSALNIGANTEASVATNNATGFPSEITPSSTGENIINDFSFFPIATLQGDFAIIVELTTNNTRASGTEVGVMIRRGLGTDDAFACAGVLNNGGSDIGQLTSRASKGGLPVTANVASNDNMNPTTYVRFAMNGANVEAEFEYNPASFTTPDQTVAYSGTAHILGFYVKSGDGTPQDFTLNYYFE